MNTRRYLIFFLIIFCLSGCFIKRLKDTEDNTKAVFQKNAMKSDWLIRTFTHARVLSPGKPWSVQITQDSLDKTQMFRFELVYLKQALPPLQTFHKEVLQCQA